MRWLLPACVATALCMTAGPVAGAEPSTIVSVIDVTTKVGRHDAYEAYILRLVAAAKKTEGALTWSTYESVEDGVHRYAYAVTYPNWAALDVETPGEAQMLKSSYSEAESRELMAAALENISDANRSVYFYRSLLSRETTNGSASLYVNHYYQLRIGVQQAFEDLFAGAVSRVRGGAGWRLYTPALGAGRDNVVVVPITRSIVSEGAPVSDAELLEATKSDQVTAVLATDLRELTADAWTRVYRYRPKLSHTR